MKKIEWFWNMMYYTLYLLDMNMSSIFRYINPVYWINKIPQVKKHHSKHGIDDMNKFIFSFFSDFKNGDSSIIASGILSSLVLLIEVGMLNIIASVLNLDLYEGYWSGKQELIVLVALMLPVWIINRYLSFKNNKYLKYFEEFKMLAARRRKCYVLASSFTILFIVIFFIVSFFAL